MVLGVLVTGVMVMVMVVEVVIDCRMVLKCVAGNGVACCIVVVLK